MIMLKPRNFGENWVSLAWIQNFCIPIYLYFTCCQFWTVHMFLKLHFIDSNNEECAFACFFFLLLFFTKLIGTQKVQQYIQCENFRGHNSFFWTSLDNSLFWTSLGRNFSKVSNRGCMDLKQRTPFAKKGFHCRCIGKVLKHYLWCV